MAPASKFPIPSTQPRTRRFGSALPDFEKETHSVATARTPGVSPRRSIRLSAPKRSSPQNLGEADATNDEASTTIADMTSRLAPATFTRRRMSAEPEQHSSTPRRRTGLATDNRAYTPGRSGADTDEGFEDAAARHAAPRPRGLWEEDTLVMSTPAVTRKKVQERVADGGETTEEEVSFGHPSPIRPRQQTPPSRHSPPVEVCSHGEVVDAHDDDASLEQLSGMLEAGNLVWPHDGADTFSRPSFAVGSALGRALGRILSFLGTSAATFFRVLQIAFVALGLYVVFSLFAISPSQLLPAAILQPPAITHTTEDLELSTRVLAIESVLASIVAVLPRVNDLEVDIQAIRQTIHEVPNLAEDTLGRPDYALYSGGASVVEDLTSETFEAARSGMFAPILDVLFPRAVGPLPETALQPDTHNGECWPFAGARGRLGVALPARVRIAAVSVDHVAKAVATDLRSAPRAMQLWGRVDGDENVRRLAEWRTPRFAWSSKDGTRGHVHEGELANEDGEVYTMLAEFEYNIDARRNVQTFDLPPEVRELDMDFEVVVLRVLSNWGHPEHTCLYRFRVHGEQVGGQT